MKTFFAMMALAGVLALSGCASIEMGKNFEGCALSPGKENVAHVSGKVNGLYLLSIPLITGNPESMSPAFLKDTVKVEVVGAMVAKAAKGEGATAVVDMSSKRSALWIAPLFVGFWRSVEVSANGVK